MVVQYSLKFLEIPEISESKVKNITGRKHLHGTVNQT